MTAREGGVSGWRRELVEAVDRVLTGPVKGGDGGWRSLGQASRLPGDEPGWWTLDLRAGDRPLSADSFDQLCLADRDGPDNGTSLPVERVRVADGLVKIKVDGALPDGCDRVWTIRLTPRHLWQKLRDGIAGLDEAPLADRLAAGRLDPLPTGTHDYPPGFLSAQQIAYRACTEPGLHAVWGPPGTGKTRVLARAIEDLVKRGWRVLLVSTANIAVDNALKEVVKNIPTDQGQVIRVGPPHLPELAADDNVQLQRLAARTTAEVDAELEDVREHLVQADRVDARIAVLDVELAGYDHPAYLCAIERIDRRAEVARLEADRPALVVQHLAADGELNAKVLEMAAVDAERRQVEPQRRLLDQAAGLAAALRSEENDFRRLRERVASAEEEAATTRGLFARRKAVKAAAKWAEQAAVAERRFAPRRSAIEAELNRIRATVHVTPTDLEVLDRRAAETRTAVSTAQSALDNVRRTLDALDGRCAWSRGLGIADDRDDETVASARRGGLPARHEERARLHDFQRSAARDRPQWENRLRELTKKITKLRRDAEGEIVAGARVVATTLARSRAHPAVAREKFDVVLVDEAGAALLAEVLLAVGRATRTAVLLGDFLQLGPVTGDIDKTDHAGVRKWVKPDVFTHCGILAPADVTANPGAVALLHQFRFGPNLRELANNVIYGVLRDGAARPDTEIVLVDVSRLPDLGVIHRSSRFAGWWPVGALVARALAQHHVTDGDVGVVTTFKQQAEATLAALRDVGPDFVVPVGTAHSFQGREFDTVIFDLVEDGQGWISKARSDRGSFEYSAVRLFGVGITRARHRLYLIVNSQLAVKGAVGNSPLGAVRRLAQAGRIQWVRAGALLGLEDEHEYKPVSSVEAELHDVLRGLVEVTDIEDEFAFKETLAKSLAKARRSVWMWSPWVGKHGKRFMPLIADAVARGVDVRVFTRNDTDFIQRNDTNQEWLQALKATGARIIRARLEHKKIVVIDQQVVLIGSLNALSHGNSREVMLTCRGSAFAKRLLADLGADGFADPPACTRCRAETELHRSADRKRGTPYFWRCPRCKHEALV
ncbi:AAA domain-containing protein [Saccharothrix sp. NRRL B-16314]|uniref:AAA domain-containing protein n=1 Tax=Saccharothrix sp. NRRL B-16314 TaxID=1463825 RepID=UPI0018CC2B6B|nr:AAA domain-containing protein [Saccharothrix sp. NRRL B-16314]